MNGLTTTARKKYIHAKLFESKWILIDFAVNIGRYLLQKIIHYVESGWGWG
jgi:hypothetical protein